MLPSKQNVESFTGLLAVGSIGVLGVFLIIDGQTNIYLIFEEYGKSTSWSIFAAVPLLVLSYLLGLFLSQAAEILFTNVKRLNSAKAEEQFVKVVILKNEHLIERYLELSRQKRLLESSSIALLLLLLGALSEVKQMQGWEMVAYGSSILALIVATVCPFMVIRVAKKIECLLLASNGITPNTEEKNGSA